jgi:tetratricopeptide (TPR) repeat protein
MGRNGELPPDFWDIPPWSARGCKRMKVNGGKIPLEVQFAYRQAVELARQGNYEVAFQRLKQVVTAAPRFAKAFNEMGNCLTHMGRDLEALSKFEKALKEDPSFQEAYYNRSMILEKLGRRERGTGGITN